jgi:hypothetical protein
MPVIDGRRVLVMGAVLAMLAGSACTMAGLANPPLARREPRGATSTAGESPRSNELLLILAFSGGGPRAVAFASGVLEELAATPVAFHVSIPEATIDGSLGYRRPSIARSSTREVAEPRDG